MAERTEEQEEIMQELDSLMLVDDLSPEQAERSQYPISKYPIYSDADEREIGSIEEGLYYRRHI
jgi:hypothetical protein